MELELITDMAPQAWDEAIEGFDTKCLFHESKWLKFIEETQGAETLRLRIADNGKTEGYFVGLVVRKGPLKVLGSPLPGWTTDYMGPVVNRGFDFEKFLDALDAACRLLKVHHVELCSPFLPSDLLKAKGYEVENSSTYIVPLSGDEEEMWGGLDRKCRQNIRKGLQNRLRVEICDDPAIADEYYAELIDVFARQKLVPSYPVERVRSLFTTMHPSSIIALKVMDGDRAIASALFPYDGRSAYMFGAASWRSYQNRYPNELLYWTGMTLLAKKGIPQLDMCGDGAFKPKFGAKLVPVYKCSKSYSFVARLGREAYRKAFKAKQAFCGKLSS